MPPETRYAQKGETSIAYQVVGDGPLNLVLANGIVSHMSLLWGDPAASALFRRLTSFARLVLFDKPGTGLSDPVAGPHALRHSRRWRSSARTGRGSPMTSRARDRRSSSSTA